MGWDSSQSAVRIPHPTDPFAISTAPPPHSPIDLPPDDLSLSAQTCVLPSILTANTMPLLFFRHSSHPHHCSRRHIPNNTSAATIHNINSSTFPFLHTHRSHKVEYTRSNKTIQRHTLNGTICHRKRSNAESKSTRLCGIIESNDDGIASISSSLWSQDIARIV